METLGKRIKSLRMSLGLNQAQLADRAGVSKGHISAIKHERYLPAIKTAVKIASALNISMDELVRGERNDKRS